MSSFGLFMTNTNVPVVLGIVPPTWAGTVRFYPQAIPNVILFLFVNGLGWVLSLFRNLLLANQNDFVVEDNLIAHLHFFFGSLSISKAIIYLLYFGCILFILLGTWSFGISVRKQTTDWYRNYPTLHNWLILIHA